METNSNPMNTEGFTPGEYIHYFYSQYPVIEVKGILLEWLVSTLKDEGEGREYVQTPEFNRFYTELNKLLPRFTKHTKVCFQICSLRL